MTCVFIISAPSGSGKSTLVQRLLRIGRRPALFHLLHHARPRGAEVDGHDYFFISREEFELRLKQQRIPRVGHGLRQLLRNPPEQLRARGGRGPRPAARHRCERCATIKGTPARRDQRFHPASIRQILEERLRARSEDAENVIQRRLREAAEEIRNYDQYDYVLVNQERRRVGAKRCAPSFTPSAEPARGWKKRFGPS